MKNTALTNIAIAAAIVLCVGVLAGCDYCQPLLLASAIYLVVTHWLPSANQSTQYQNFAS